MDPSVVQPAQLPPQASLPAQHVVVIGGGPAGLTAAYELDRLGVAATVLESSGDLGGISRTVEYKAFRFDIGGHRFFSKSEEIEALWTELLGEEMLERARLSRILYRRRFFNYPIKAMNALRNLGLPAALACLGSYAKAKVFPKRDVRTFEDWTVNAFGRRLYETFFKTYTEKVWGIPCSQISADWAAQRIKGLSLRSLLVAAISPKSRDRGSVIKTLIEAFRYPALGPGQMWDAVGARLARNGRRVVRNARVVSIERGAHGATRVITADGRTYAPTDLLSSMPLRELIEIVHPAAPESVRSAAAALGYRDFITVALVIAAPNLFADNWIYIHDEGVKLGRIQNFKNWSPQMVPDPNATCLGLEYFCFEGDELWNATDKELIALGTAELAKLGLADPADVVDGTVVRQPKAYPVYDDRYQEHLTTIRTWLESALPNVQLIGRNGMHRYNNQDHAMMTGLLAARNIARGEHFNLWAVNSDAIYTEEVRSGESTTLGAQR